MNEFIKALDAHTVREEAKLDRIGEHLANLAGTQREQKVILEEHIRRTVALEESLVILADRVSPLERSALAWAKVWHAMVAVVGLAGSALALWKTFFEGRHP